MGKGARTREKNAEELKIKKEQEKVSTQKKKRNKFAAIIVSLVLVVAVAAGALVNGFYFANGQYLRNQTAASSTNEKVSGSMLLYLFENSLNTYKNYYGDYFSSLTGVDLTKSLKSQAYGSESDTTWFDYLMGETKTALTEVMTLCEQARASGFELTDEQNQIIEDQAKNVDLSSFSSKISREDVKNCIQMSTLASLYKQSIESAYKYSDADLQKQYDDNKNDYDKVAYRSYTITFTTDEDSTDESSNSSAESSTVSAESSDTSSDTESSSAETTKITLKQPEAQLKAYELKSATSEDNFIEIVKSIEKTLNPSVTDDELETTINTTLTKNVSYTEDNDLSTWAFDAERKVGDTYITGDADTGSYKVYYLTAAPARDESATVSARHILFTSDKYGSDDAAKAKAEEILNEWKSGAATAESFGELALKYTEDSATMYTGGLYENIKQGSLETEFNDWIFDSSRKAGDTDIVKTSYGYHIIYFVGSGLQQWQADVKTDLVTNEYSKDLATFEATYSVTYTDDVVNSIPA